MFSSRLESYFLENEKKVNRLISKILPLFCIVGPIIFLCNKLGIFSVDEKGLIIFSISIIILTIFVFIFVLLGQNHDHIHRLQPIEK